MERGLGYIETLCAIGHDIMYGAALGVSTAEITGPLTPALVRAALERVQARHPLLRARLAHAGDGYRFVVEEPAPEIQLVMRVRASDDEWRAVEAAEYRDPIASDLAMWRVIVLFDPHGQRHTFILTLNHTIADGVARELFHDEFLRACAAVHAGDAAPVVSLPLPPSIESRLPDRTRWADFTAAVQADAVDRPTPDPWPFVRAAPVAERVPHMILAGLAAPLPAVLRARAREHGTTVNAAIGAAMLQTAARMAGGALTTSLGTSVNLRTHAEPGADPDDFGCFMINVRTHHAIADGDDVWAVARAYREQLVARTPAQAHTPIDFDTAVLRARFDPAIIDRATQYPFRLGLSNLGAYPHASRHGAFALTDMHVGTSRRAGLYAGFVHTMTLDGRMSLGLSYVEPLLSSDWAAAFVDGVVAALTAVAR